MGEWFETDADFDGGWRLIRRRGAWANVYPWQGQYRWTVVEETDSLPYLHASGSADDLESAKKIAGETLDRLCW